MRRKTLENELERVVADLRCILEPNSIGWYTGTDRVEFSIEKPRPSLGPRKKFPFEFTLPYRVGEKKEGRIVTPARTAGFGPRAAAYVENPDYGSPWRQVGEMQREAAEELTIKFIHRRLGLEDCQVNIGDLTTALFDRSQPSKSGPKLNAFRALGELSVEQPLRGYANLAVFGLIPGLYKYLYDQILEQEKSRKPY